MSYNGLKVKPNNNLDMVITLSEFKAIVDQELTSSIVRNMSAERIRMLYNRMLRNLLIIRTGLENLLVTYLNDELLAIYANIYELIQDLLSFIKTAYTNAEKLKANFIKFRTRYTTCLIRLKKFLDLIKVKYAELFEKDDEEEISNIELGG